MFSSGVDEFRCVMPTNAELSIRQKNARLIAMPDLFAAAGRLAGSFDKLLGGAGAVAVAVRFESITA